ncbi:hypothetical protein H9P43_008834 [Blastocladiella emersonii ATCC 22665]|nr:hypothetical protein H9P43_008834 [Blastocladiella emersonii ATCC 22665]
MSSDPMKPDPATLRAAPGLLAAAIAVYGASLALAAYLACRVLPRIRLPRSLSRVAKAQWLLVSLSVLSNTIQLVCHAFPQDDVGGAFNGWWFALGIVDNAVYATMLNLYIYLALWRIQAALPPAWAHATNSWLTLAAMVGLFALMMLSLAGYYLPAALCISGTRGAMPDPDVCTYSYLMSAEILFTACDLSLALLYIYSWRRHARMLMLPQHAMHRGVGLVVLAFLGSAATMGLLMTYAFTPVDQDPFFAGPRILWMVHTAIMIAASAKLTRQLADALTFNKGIISRSFDDTPVPTTTLSSIDDHADLGHRPRSDSAAALAAANGNARINAVEPPPPTSSAYPADSWAAYPASAPPPRPCWFKRLRGSGTSRYGGGGAGSATPRSLATPLFASGPLPSQRGSYSTTPSPRSGSASLALYSPAIEMDSGIGGGRKSADSWVAPGRGSGGGGGGGYASSEDTASIEISSDEDEEYGHGHQLHSSHRRGGGSGSGW